MHNAQQCAESAQWYSGNTYPWGRVMKQSALDRLFFFNLIGPIKYRGHARHLTRVNPHEYSVSEVEAIRHLVCLFMYLCFAASTRLFGGQVSDALST